VTAERFRLLVSGVLIVGVVTAAVLIGLGVVTALLVGWGGSLSGVSPDGEAATAFAAMGTNLADLRPVGFAQLGLVVLLATPVARVASSVLAFVLEGDRLYAAITLAVLLVLLTSIFLLR
jgi:uncharacterized membrane protein